MDQKVADEEDLKKLGTVKSTALDQVVMYQEVKDVIDRKNAQEEVLTEKNLNPEKLGIEIQDQDVLYQYKSWMERSGSKGFESRGSGLR